MLDDGDVRFSHVDMIVEDVQAFLDHWCPRMPGWVASPIQQWGSKKDSAWSSMALVFSRSSGELMFMVVQGHHGVHVDLLREYGQGAMYRLCFKTDNLQACYHKLKASGIQIMDLNGVEYSSWQDVENAEKPILWLERWNAMRNCPRKFSWHRGLMDFVMICDPNWSLFDVLTIASPFLL